MFCSYNSGKFKITNLYNVLSAKWLVENAMWPYMIAAENAYCIRWFDEWRTSNKIKIDVHGGYPIFHSTSKPAYTSYKMS